MNRLVKEKINSILCDINETSRSKNLTTVFSIANTANTVDPSITFAANRETKNLISGNIIISEPKDSLEVAKYLDGKVEVILLDIERKKFSGKDYERIIRNAVKISEILTFKPNDFTVDALDSFISVMSKDISGKKIAVIGCGNIGSKITLKLLERDADVTITRKHGNEEALQTIAQGLELMKCKGTSSKISYTTDNLSAAKDAYIIIGCSAGTVCINEKMVNLMDPDGIIIDAGNKTVSQRAIEAAAERNIEVYTLFMQPGFEGQMACLLETKRLTRRLGRKKVGCYNLVSAGLLGKKGDVLVDDISSPSKIIGIADGQGGLEQTQILPTIEQIRGEQK